VYPFYVTNLIFHLKERKIMFQFGSKKHKKVISAIVILLVVVMIFSTVAVALM